MAQKLTFKDFEKRANEIHNGKYTYKEETFVSTKVKTSIFCPIHGEFYQTPKNHMKGQGCPECGKNIAREYHKHNYQPFLEEAAKRFGNKFSFPNIEDQYINNKTYITVKCNVCGYEFSRRPNDLLSDKFNGCKNCKHLEVLNERKKKNKSKVKVKQYRVSKEDYLKRFTDKFGDSITPFMNEYVNTQVPIHYKCNKCGLVFERRPHNCLDSDGCPKCKHVNNQRFTTDDFIKKAKEIHGDKYDYSESEYKNTDVKLKVICHEKDEFGDEHGEFWVTPHSHIGIMKSGCPKCSGKFRKDTKYFIKEAKLVHGDKYIYNETVYNGALKKVKIICPIHGEFWITPNDHLNGKGCKKCGYETISDRLALKKDDFIRKSKEAHGDKYDYSKTDLNNRDKRGKVIITCPIHGDFLQNPINHMRGKGCPKCKQSHLEREIMMFLEDKHIIYEYQKKFNWLGKQSLDFYLPQYSVGIECQGKQHFTETLFGNVNENIEKDNRKRKLCEENGIKLLYYSNLGIKYPYFVFENKEKLLKEIIK